MTAITGRLIDVPDNPLSRHVLAGHQAGIRRAEAAISVGFDDRYALTLYTDLDAPTRIQIAAKVYGPRFKTRKKRRP